MRIGRLAARVMAVAVLVLGLVVMHHVARAGTDGASSHESPTMAADANETIEHAMGANVVAGDLAADTEHGDASSAGHDLLHLCLAVVSAAAVLVVGWLLLVRRPWLPTSSFVAFRARPKPSRAPPRPHGSALLMSLCVMRT